MESLEAGRDTSKGQELRAGSHERCRARILRVRGRQRVAGKERSSGRAESALDGGAHRM
jgi:hypothetical protein